MLLKEIDINLSNEMPFVSMVSYLSSIDTKDVIFYLWAK